MIESTSSWTKASGSNLNVLIANFTIAGRNSAPGMSLCAASQASRRAAMPLACGIPPTPGDCSITRLLSVMANWPSRKKPSRGVVDIQLGLPRPAFRNADCDVLEAALARSISSFLISKGLKVSNFLSVRRSAMASSCGRLFVQKRRESRGYRSHRLSRLRQQDDKNHSPDCQQRVSDGICNGVAKPRNLALGAVVDHAERSCCRSCAGTTSQQNRIIEAKHVLSDEHRQDQRHRRNNNAPEEEAEAKLLQPGNKARPGRDADHGDEHVEADRIHEPHGRRWYSSEGRTHRAQPSEEKSGNQRAAGGGQRERYATDLVDKRADQRTDRDSRTNKGHIGRVDRALRYGLLPL